MYKDPSEIDHANPHSLFKYRAFNAHSLAELINRKIYFASPLDFNDPFECNFSVQYPTNVLSDNTKAQIEAFLAKIETDLGNSSIYSMSATPFEVLMWSHYANQHEGFCIEYVREAGNELDSKACSAVKYDEPDVLNLPLGDLLREPASFLQQVFHRKAKSWAYESEWRLVYMSPIPPTNRLRKLNARI